MKIVDEMSSLVYEGNRYTYDAICNGCSKWLSLIGKQYAEEKKSLLWARLTKSSFF